MKVKTDFFSFKNFVRLSSFSFPPTISIIYTVHREGLTSGYGEIIPTRLYENPRVDIASTHVKQVNTVRRYVKW